MKSFKTIFITSLFFITVYGTYAQDRGEAKNNVINNASFIMTDYYGPNITDLPSVVSQLNMKIYPNPTRDYINLEIGHRFERCEIIISDIIGNKIKSQLCNRQIEMMITLDDLSDGIYIIRLYGDNAVLGNQKFVVTR